MGLKNSPNDKIKWRKEIQTQKRGKETIAIGKMVARGETLPSTKEKH